MKILSLDASTKSTGYAIFENKKLIDYGCITASSTDLVKRINKMIVEIEQILTKYNIEKVVLEEVHPEQSVQNIKTHKALMYLQAAIIFLLHERFNKLEVIFLYPSEWRKLCGIKTGRTTNRASLKPMDIAFVRSEYKINVNDDIADAIGIGHAYITRTFNEINWE